MKATTCEVSRPMMPARSGFDFLGGAATGRRRQTRGAEQVEASRRGESSEGKSGWAVQAGIGCYDTAPQPSSLRGACRNSGNGIGQGQELSRPAA